MTNPDNVGGLPLLQFAVFDEFGKGADDRVWDYGRLCFEAGRELCRASPAAAGGFNIITTEKDSAPAGSGEVDGASILIHVQQLWLDGHMDECALNEISAILRKLQQSEDDGWKADMFDSRMKFAQELGYAGIAEALEDLERLRKLQQGADGWRPATERPTPDAMIALFIASPADGGPQIRQGRFDPIFGYVDSTTAMGIDPDAWAYVPTASQDQESPK